MQGKPRAMPAAHPLRVLRLPAVCTATSMAMPTSLMSDRSVTPATPQSSARPGSPAHQAGRQPVNPTCPQDGATVTMRGEHDIGVQDRKRQAATPGHFPADRQVSEDIQGHGLKAPNPIQPGHGQHRPRRPSPGQVHNPVLVRRGGSSPQEASAHEPGKSGLRTSEADVQAQLGTGKHASKYTTRRPPRARDLGRHCGKRYRSACMPRRWQGSGASGGASGSRLAGRARHSC
jgi:hypothetical protein